MTDIASLVLAVDSTSVPKATASLDGLTAAGARAEAATLGLGRGSKGAAAEAAAMAAAAQASARAVMGQAAGFGAATQAARVNTVAMRETLVVARELSRGNFTRIPGSLSLLAQGIGSQGGIGAFASAISQQLGLIKQVQNAELAEAAAAAASAAAGVEAAARKAAANVAAADTEIALAEAQLRVTQGTSAEAAAQIRLAEAHQAVSAAAAEAAVAEDALAVAMGRSAEAGAKSAAATRTVIGGSGVGLLGIGTVAVIAYAAIKQFQDQVRDSGELDDYADKLNLTDAQIKKLGGSVTYLGHNIKEVHGLTVSFGDVMHSTWSEIAREVSNAAPWNALAAAATSAFSSILSAWNKVSAGISAGLMFIIDAGKAALNGSLFTGKFDAAGDLKGRYADELKRNAEAFGNIRAGAISNAEKRLQDLSDGNNPRAPKKPKKESDHGLQEALDKLDAEIAGQYALAQAYQVSDAAAQRTIAHQKAAEDAIQHKGSADLFYSKELQKAVATDVAGAAKRNADLQFETSVRARLNDEIAAGTITVAQANNQLQLETKLRGLNVDLENADAAHKQTVRDVIKQTIDLENEQLQLESQLNALKQIAANDNDIARMKLETSLLGASNKERAVALAQLEAMQQLKDIDPNGLLTRGQRNDFVQSAIDRATASVRTPFQEWAATVPQTADAITEALQGIETKGFDNLASAIAGVVTGTESLGHAFRDVARSIISDIIQMTVKMLIFRAIGGIFGAGLGGGGINVGGASIADSMAASAPHLAGGGSFIIGGNGGVDNNVLSLNGKPVAMVGQGEGLSVYPNRSAANSNAPAQIELTVAFGPAPEFAPYVQAVAGAAAGQAVQVSVKHTNDTIRSIARPKLMGGR